MEKNTHIVAILLTAVLCGSVLFSSAHGTSRSTPPSSHFRDIPPVILKAQDGRQYKFDIDVLQDSAQTTGEPYTYVNHHSRDALLKLIRGGSFTINYGSPFGPIDSVKITLLDGRVNVKEGPNGNVILNGKQFTLLDEYAPSGNSQAQLPSNLKRGAYNLVIMFTYSEELRGYYIIYTAVR